MGRKKRPVSPSKGRRVFRPFCYFCEKEYPDETTLVNHQRAVHFKCPFCVKRSHNARGLVSHVEDIHRENITAIPQALSHRRAVDTAVVGMTGVPSDLIISKASGTDLERFILEDKIHLHPVFSGRDLKQD